MVPSRMASVQVAKRTIARPNYIIHTWLDEIEKGHDKHTLFAFQVSVSMLQKKDKYYFGFGSCKSLQQRRTELCSGCFSQKKQIKVR